MKPHPAWSALPVPLHANVQETPLTGASSARSHASASLPISLPDPLTRASFLPSPPNLLFPAPPSSHPERCSPTALSPPGQSPPQRLPTSNTQESPLSQLADARRCHTASNYPDCSPYRSSCTGTMVYSLPSQRVSTLAGPWWHLFFVISELKQPHCSPRSATVMDTAESQANGQHCPVLPTLADLQSRAPLQPTKLGQDASFQPLQQSQLTGSSGQGQQHALGRSSGSGDASAVQSSTG